jgi:aspartyl-tRNA(Asn)/glutamyl-tRNA(Gln) amidotransferase subunit B
MRSKEEAHDYRYFPEPDLVPVHVDKEWIETVRTTLPELPTERRNRFVREYMLPKYDADVLTAEKDLADYFESVVQSLAKKTDVTYKLASNWTMTDVLRVLKERHLEARDFPAPPQYLAELINLIVDGTISGKIAKEVFEEMLAANESPKVIVERKGLIQVSDVSTIEKVVDEILAKNAEQVATYLSGKHQVFGFFVGETMKAMKGTANPKIVNELLKRKFEEMNK